MKETKVAICKCCQEPFTKVRPLQRACSPSCALWIAKEKREKVERKETKEKLTALKSRSEWLKSAQEQFNKFIRLRDRDEPCISCQRFHAGQIHAGHYLSTGARPELRFNEANCFAQCQPCNTHLHGNLVLYRINLLARVGVDKVAWLEGPHPAMKYTVDELKAIVKEYRLKAKRLLKLLSERSEDVCEIRAKSDDPAYAMGA